MEKGDTLWEISQRYYGNPELYPVFLECNKIRNPRALPIGKVIIIPDRSELEAIAAENDENERLKKIRKIQMKNALSEQISDEKPDTEKRPPGKPIKAEDAVLKSILGKELRSIKSESSIKKN